MCQINSTKFPVAGGLKTPSSPQAQSSATVDLRQLGDRLEHYVDGYTRNCGDGVPSNMELDEEGATLSAAVGCSEPGCPIALPSNGRYHVTNRETNESATIDDMTVHFLKKHGKLPEGVSVADLGWLVTC